MIAIKIQLLNKQHAVIYELETDLGVTGHAAIIKYDGSYFVFSASYSRGRTPIVFIEVNDPIEIV